MTEMHLITDEKLRSDDEEQHEPGNNLRRIFADVHHTRDISAAAVQKRDEKRRQNHVQRLKLSEPRHHDGSKAQSVLRPLVNGVTATADEQKPCQPADRTLEAQRTDNNLFYVDTYIHSGFFTAADDRNLITVFGILQIHIHTGCQ